MYKVPSWSFFVAAMEALRHEVLHLVPGLGLYLQDLFLRFLRGSFQISSYQKRSMSV